MRTIAKRWLAAALLIAAAGWFHSEAAAQGRRPPPPPEPRQEDPLAALQGRFVQVRHIGTRGDVYNEGVAWMEIRGDRFSTYIDDSLALSGRLEVKGGEGDILFVDRIQKVNRVGGEPGRYRTILRVTRDGFEMCTGDNGEPRPRSFQPERPGEKYVAYRRDR